MPLTSVQLAVSADLCKFFDEQNTKDPLGTGMSVSMTSERAFLLCALKSDWELLGARNEVPGFVRVQ